VLVTGIGIALAVWWSSEGFAGVLSTAGASVTGGYAWLARAAAGCEDSAPMASGRCRAGQIGGRRR